MFVSLIPMIHRARRALLLASVAAFAVGCSGRDRPITPTGPGGGEVVPLITITQPGSDTVISEGSTVVVIGDAQDDIGVDSIFFTIQGAPFALPPTNVDGATVTFSFTVPTSGLAGSVLTISITAKDEDGNQGGPTRRLLSIQ
jgi:hypothetical protein